MISIQWCWREIISNRVNRTYSISCRYIVTHVLRKYVICWKIINLCLSPKACNNNIHIYMETKTAQGAVKIRRSRNRKKNFWSILSDLSIKYCIMNMMNLPTYPRVTSHRKYEKKVSCLLVGMINYIICLMNFISDC